MGAFLAFRTIDDDSRAYYSSLFEADFVACWKPPVNFGLFFLLTVVVGYLILLINDEYGFMVGWLGSWKIKNFFIN